MAGLCRILIAATLVVHLMVGCCAHHAHGCEGEDRLSPAHHDATHDGQCTESGGDRSQHGAPGCQEVKCSYVSPSRPASDCFVQPSQASFAALLNDLPSLVGIGSGLRFRATGRLLLPVRLHLANQVLLI
jgi:hypothetical protein